MPTLTIGVPVYNGQKYLMRALESISLQYFTDFEVIISDNDSTDTTPQICNDMLQRDDRFRYVKQKHNIGAINNFKFLIDACTSPYFVYLAADDYWHPDFLFKNIQALEADLTAICCISRVALENNGQYLYESNGTFAITGNVRENLRQYFHALPNDNSRFYGLYRTDVLRNSFAGAKPFHALDWLMMASTLLHGTHLEIDEVLMGREVAESDRYRQQAEAECKSFPFSVLPILEMTLALRRIIGVRRFIALLWPLAVLNYRKYKEYQPR